jgi:hypothetical protein
LGADFLTGLARLLQEDRLESLTILHDDSVPLGGIEADFHFGFSESVEDVQDFVSALGSSSTLTELRVVGVNLFWDVESGLSIIRACEGLGSLRRLDLANNRVSSDADDKAAYGAALASLLRNTPSLEALDLGGCCLADDGARQLFPAVPDAQLSALDCSGNNITAACVREHVLPALRASPTLRSFMVRDGPRHPLEPFTVVVPAAEHLVAEALVLGRTSFA